MTQVIREENSGTNTILIVLVLAAIVAFGVWFFGQGVVPTNTENPGINVDVNLPTGGTETQAPAANTGTPQ